MKTKKFLGLTIAALALMLSACGQTGGNSGSSINGSSSSASDSTSQGGGESNNPTVRVSGVALNANEFSGKVGDKFTLTATVSPANAYNPEVVWSTNNMLVATVDNGKVEIVGKGVAVITVKTIDGGFIDTCTVKCEDDDTEKVQVVCYADELVDSYCWNMDEDKPDAENYEGKTKDGHMIYSYEAGSVVYVLPDYDDESVKLLGYIYYVDGKAAGICGILDYCFYLEVPAEAKQVIILPVANELPAPDTNEYYRIYNGSEHARIETLSNAKVNNGYLYGVAGSKVEFTLNIEAGYDFVGVSVITASAPVEAVLNANGNYEFIMPKEPVQITVATKAHNFALNRIDEKGLIDSVYVGEEKISNSVGYAPCDEVITILFNNTNKDYVVKGVAVTNLNGEYIGFFEAIQDGRGVAFYMPCFGINVEVVYAKRSFKVNLVNTEHAQLVPFAKVEDKYVALDPEDLEIEYYGTLYFKVATDDPSYTAKQIQLDAYQYVSFVGSTNPYNQTSKVLTANEDGYFTLSITYLVYGELTVRLTGELNDKLLKDTDLVGTYLGMPMWDTDRSFEPSASYRSVILNNGDWKEGSTQYYIKSFNKYTGVGAYENTSYPDRNYVFMYKDNFFYTCKSFEGAWTSTYKYVYCKMQPGDSDDQYKFYAESFKKGSYYVVQVERDGLPYANLFLDNVEHKMYTNVNFVFESGEHVNDANAIYNVKFGANCLFEVGYKGTNGSAATRCLREEGSIKGAFTSAEGQMVVFDGFNHVEYDGNVWNVEVDAEGNVSGTRTGSKDTLSFKVYPTLGVVENIELLAYQYKNVLEGRVFTGKCGKYWYSSGSHANDKTVDITIEFVDDKHVTLKVYSGTTYYLGNVTKQSLLDENYYTISGSFVEVWFHDKDSSYTLKNWNFRLSDDYMELTCTSTNRLADANYDYDLPDKGPLSGSALNGYMPK